MLLGVPWRWSSDGVWSDLRNVLDVLSYSYDHVSLQTLIVFYLLETLGSVLKTHCGISIIVFLSCV